MIKKIKWAFFESLGLFIIYQISIVANEIIQEQINQSVTDNEQVNLLLRMIGFVFSVLSTGYFELVVGIVIISLTLLKENDE